MGCLPGREHLGRVRVQVLPRALVDRAARPTGRMENNAGIWVPPEGVHAGFEFPGKPHVVVVEERNVLAAGGVDPAIAGGPRTVRTPGRDDANAGIIEHTVRHRSARAVVHDDDLEVVEGLGQDGRYRTIEEVGAVAGRYDHRDDWLVRHRSRPSRIRPMPLVRSRARSLRMPTDHLPIRA